MEKTVFKMNLEQINADGDCSAEVNIKGNVLPLARMIAVTLKRRPEIMALLLEALEQFDNVDEADISVITLWDNSKNTNN